MALKHEEDADRFKDRLDQLGIAHKTNEISQALNISASHAGNMLHGRKVFTAPMKVKIDALIAAKASGQDKVEVPYPKVLPVIDATVGKLARTGYLVDPNNETGEYRIIRIIANCTDYHTACELCDLLNKESG